MENTGQVICKGETINENLEALKEYLTDIYGPNNFKIIYFTEAEELDKDVSPVEIPQYNPPTSKVLN